MGRIAIVTGGTRGLGASISRALAAQGCRVAAVYHGDDKTAAAFADETGIPAFKWDVSDFETCKLGIDDVTSKIGPPDIIVNNAGITRDASLRKMTLEQWISVINTNLGSMFNMCRNVVDGMRDRKFGRIINISSINGQKG